jgi:hypothetical protein
VVSGFDIALEITFDDAVGGRSVLCAASVACSLSLSNAIANQRFQRRR